MPKVAPMPQAAKPVPGAFQATGRNVNIPLPPSRPGNPGQVEPQMHEPRAVNMPLPQPRAANVDTKPEPKLPVEKHCGPVPLEAKEKIEEAKLDVLFVVDTSASLRVGDKANTPGELQQIASQMGNFVNAFPSQTDIRIAVMLGHGETQHTGRLFSAGKGDPAVLKVSDFGNDRNRLGRLLEEKMKKVPNESGEAQGEALMLSLYRSIQDSNRRNEIMKQDFYRKDAALAVIFITDEQDVCFNYEGTKFKPVLKAYKNKKGEVTYAPDKQEAAFFKRVCSVAGPGQKPLTHNITLEAIRRLKQNEKIVLFGLVYTSEQSVPKVGNEDENEMGHGIIDLVGLQDNSENKLADLGAVQDGPNKFGPELAYFANQAKKELETNGRVECQPQDHKVTEIDVRTMKAELFDNSGKPLGIFSAEQNTLTSKTRANSRSNGFWQVTLNQGALNKILKENKSPKYEVKLTYMTRTDEVPELPAPVAKKKK